MPPLERIAFEKSGIAKATVPRVCQKYAPSMLAEIAKQAIRAGGTLVDRGESWDAASYESRLHYHDNTEKLSLPLPRMAGPHQADNAALAVAMLRHQHAIAISESALVAAMEWTRWPARMQRLAQGPLADLLPKGTEIWLDGGHNADGGRAIAAHFADESRRIHLITGMLANKDPTAIIAPLTDRLASITVLPVPGHEHHGVKAFGQGAVASSDITTALQSLDVDPTAQIILIAGTLYLAGAVLTANGQLLD